MLLFTVQCSEDDPAPLISLSGTITYPGTSGNLAAGGAIVYLAKTAGALEYDYSTIADASGNYSFDNLEAGTYYLNANYYTGNANARLEGLYFNAGDDILVTVEAIDVTQSFTLVSIGQVMDAVSVNYDGLEGGAGNTGDWDLDGNHTSLDFAFFYGAENAEFTGSFDRITNLVINVDPTSLSTSSIVAEIDLLSVNTGKRGGRDPLWDGEYNALTESTVFVETNCIARTFGIYEDGAFPSTVTDPNRYAKFESTSIEAYGDGFIAKGNMTFSAVMLENPSSPYDLNNNPNTPVTKSVSIIFKYRSGYEDANRFYSSFEGKMIFNARSDFNIFSSAVSTQPVNVYMNIQLRKNK